MKERDSGSKPESTKEKLKKCFLKILKIGAAIGLAYVAVNVVYREAKALLA